MGMGIVTQRMVFDYVVKNPGSSPPDIANSLNVSVNQVKTRLLHLLNKRKLDRVIEKSKMETMFYYPMKKRFVA
jgi:hypothetical protein